jgi:hypothetical protein
MRQRTVFVILSWLSAPAFLLGPALAQAPAMPPAQPAAQAAGRGQGAEGRGQQGRGQTAQQARRNLTITAIPGVVAEGGNWTKVWQAGGNSADGIIPDKDGSVLVAQEDYDTVLKIDNDDKASVAVANAKGVGSLSMDRQGRLYSAHRTERAGSTKPDQASIVNAIAILTLERKTIADKWADGTTLTVRPNDLAADNQGGAYFTVVASMMPARRGSPWRRRTSAPTGSASARTTRFSM